MNDLDRLYVSILHRGLIAIRNATWSQDLEFCKALSEYLHEIPSLIGEPNLLRHIYQATQASPMFSDWAKENGREDVLEFIETWLGEVWLQIDRVLQIDGAISRE